MRISPSVGSMSLLTIRIVVVLPHPDGPTKTQISPSGISKERSFTTARSEPEYVLLTPLNLIIASPVRPGVVLFAIDAGSAFGQDLDSSPSPPGNGLEKYTSIPLE